MARHPIGHQGIVARMVRASAMNFSLLLLLRSRLVGRACYVPLILLYGGLGNLSACKMYYSGEIISCYGVHPVGPSNRHTLVIMLGLLLLGGLLLYVGPSTTC